MKNKCFYVLLFFAIVFPFLSKAQTNVYEQKIVEHWQNNQTDSTLFFYERLLEETNPKKESEKYIEVQKEYLRVAYLIGKAEAIKKSIEELKSLKLHPKKESDLIHQITYQEAKYQYWKGYYKESTELLAQIPNYKNLKLYQLANRYATVAKIDTSFLEIQTFEDNKFETASQQTYFLSQLFGLYGMPKDALEFAKKAIDYLPKDANKIEEVKFKLHYTDILLLDLYESKESEKFLSEMEGVIQEYASETELALRFWWLKTSKAFVERRTRNKLQEIDSVLEICKKFPVTQSIVYDNIKMKSVLLLEARKWEEAETWIDENIEIFTKLYSEKSIQVAQLYAHKSLLYFYQNFYQKSIDYSKKILANPLASENLKMDVYKVAAVTYSKVNDYERAFEYANQYLVLTKKALGENHLQIAAIYSLFASLHREQENFEQTIEYAKRVIEIYAQTNDESLPIAIARSHQIISTAYLKLDENEKALSHSLEAKEIMEERFLKSRFYVLASTYINMGMVYRNLENYDSAYQYYHLSLAAEKSIPQKNWNIARIGVTYNNLGYAFEAQQNYDSAIFYYEKALEVKEQDWNSANVLNNLANTFSAISDFKKAKENYQTSLSLNNLGKEYADFEVAIDSYKGLAALPVFSFTERLEYYKKADEVIDKMRSQIYTDNDQLLVSKLTTEVYGKALSLCFEATKSKNIDKKIYEDAFYFAEKNRAFLLRKQTNETLFLAQVPNNLRKKEANYNSLIDHYQRQVWQLEKEEPAQSTQLAYYNQQLLETRTKHQKLKEELSSKFESYKNLEKPIHLVTTEDIKTNLREEEQMLIYQWFEPYLFIQVIDKNRQLFYRVKPIDFEKLLKNYRNGIAKDGSAEKFVTQSDALYKILIQPIISHIEKSKKLIIIPDAILQQIPFSTLISTSENKDNISYQNINYPLLNFQISFHYSSSLWNMEREKKSKEYEYEFVGLAPVFNFDETNKNLIASNSRNRLTSLPYSEEEVSQIAKLFENKGRKSLALTNQRANQENLESYATKTRRLHLATHSQTFTKTPFNSHIWLFGNDSAQNNLVSKKIYASDLYGMSFPNELVVLSSCRSGVGQVVEGEGVITLTRSFLNAGTQNIVFSLWQIDDLATKELMEIFYKQVAEGKPYTEALRLAKKELSTSEKFNSPFYWSGILLIGD
ncbi:CHAT domain-containing protein [Bernardetia sp.]|uniref:CHAT domain-containing protein n=1 Tax=Bernardetia sp. TaxID=1937974 RepID=UPI0025BD45A6|nr:CHAT domain-containing tetratricopeptide repeat protein [Bernardetia sp.]